MTSPIYDPRADLEGPGPATGVVTTRLAKRKRKLPPVFVMVPMLIMILFLFFGIFGQWVSPYDYTDQDLANRFAPPGTPGHIFGTDHLGRDILSGLIGGARITLIIGFVVLVFGVVLGVGVGVVSGFVGGRFDAFMMRIIDIWLAFPFLILAIALVAALGGGLDKLIIALVLVAWVVFARPIRGEALSLREREYVLSARALGVSRTKIVVKHLLPNLLPSILVLSSLELGAIILMEASLSFLGLGVTGGEATWGGMLSDGRAYIGSSWWLATIPGIAIFALVMSVNVIGEWFRDVFDPRNSSRAQVKQEIALP
ncbi:ABC transporter permease [Leucobacter denitrificans]|uniref:ABC transporter permease n=1 Tax=Leucobacter denitrificans TaxID=683042 RepID=A0A7G9S317_9MICO|nr:ABC transporter permease [Leucobacter denitrificans]QNN62242.1 ABC transporter permease [Leucobacter denitrificans]